MTRKTLSWLVALSLVVSAWHLTTESAQAGWGYAYYPSSYYVAPPVYAPPPVLVTHHAYPYYATPYSVSYRPAPAPVVYYRPAPVYYTPPAVTTYYAPTAYPAYYGGEMKVKYKYRRGLFHDTYKYEVEYDD